MNESHSSLSAELKRLEGLLNKDEITLKELCDSLTTRGHSLTALFFAFPFILPIPLPGLSVPFGIIILLAGIQIACDLPPKIPKRLYHVKISSLFLRRLLKAAQKGVMFFERWVKPRGLKYIAHPSLLRLSGWIITFLGLLLSLPLPPGTNAPPSLAIVLLCLAILERDLLLFGIGIFVFIFNIIFFSGMVFFGFEAIKKLMHWL